MYTYVTLLKLVKIATDSDVFHREVLSADLEASDSDSEDYYSLKNAHKIYILA